MEEYKPQEENDVPITSINDSKPFFSTVEGVSHHANSFLDLHLSEPLLRACEALGYSKPTPIQAACIPLALTGHDICGSAFTRSEKMQEAALRSLPDIVVATPGRMIDHLRNSLSLNLDELAVLVLDEADLLLELGFSTQIHELVKLCPKRRQTMLFSTTMTEKIDELIMISLNNPLRVSADPSTKQPAAVTEEIVHLRKSLEGNQEAVLLALCSKTFTSRVVVFSGTRKAAHRLKILFGLAGLTAAELHGHLTQAQRLDALELFRKQQVDFLIATDVAARGLDILGVQTVISFACPPRLYNYVRRVGRTAKAGRASYAVSFVTDDDWSLINAIVKRIGPRLRRRTVAEQSIRKWSRKIELMEDAVSSILQQEREETALRKALHRLRIR
ncbi:hypothetical protein OROGR_021469 [Orobanche gracilis]